MVSKFLKLNNFYKKNYILENLSFIENHVSFAFLFYQVDYSIHLSDKARFLLVREHDSWEQPRFQPNWHSLHTRAVGNSFHYRERLARWKKMSLLISSTNHFISIMDQATRCLRCSKVKRLRRINCLLGRYRAMWQHIIKK